MKRTTIFADDALLKEFRDLSKEENRSVAEMVREAMEQYVRLRHQKKRKLSFIGIGASEKRNVSEKHEGLLWRKSAK